MNVNNTGVNRVNNSSIQKKEKNKPLQLQQETKDLSNCPNPTEYLGRSQVVFRGKSKENVEPAKKQLPKFSEEDLQPIKLVECPIISKDEIISLLNKFGFTSEEIAEIDFDDEKNIKNFSGLKAYTECEHIKDRNEEYINDLRTSSPEKRKEFIEEIPETIIYFNQENLDTLKKYIDLDIDDIWEIYENIFDGDNKDEVLRAIPLASMAQGKLEPDYIKTLRYMTTFDSVTPERVNIIRRINELLPEKTNLPIAQCANLGNDEDLTDEKVNKYLSILENYGQKEFFNTESIVPVYQNKSLKEITDDVTQVENILEKYPMEFTQKDGDTKLSITDLQKIVQRNDIEEVQKYINSLTPEAKSGGINNIPNENSKFDKQKLAQIYNTIYDKDYGKVNYSSLNEFLEQQEANNYENLDGIIKVINRYKGTNELDTSYIDRVFTFGGNDYDSAIDALDLKDEIDKKELNLDSYTFYQTLHNPNSDLKTLNKILTYIRDNNINGYSYPNMFLSDPKGYNKLVLNHDIGKDIDNYDYNKRSKLNELGDMLNNEEEVDYAINLIKQKSNPNDENSGKRFNWYFEDVKGIMQSYQNDKESTKAIVEMKDENDSWRILSKQNILPTIEAYQLDKNTTLDILNLKNEENKNRFDGGNDIKSLVETAQIDKATTFDILNLKNEANRYLFNNCGTIKSLVETAQIDKDYTFEIINKKNTLANAKRYPYRFSSPNKVHDIVTAGQYDKDFTNYLLDLTYTDNYDTEKYRIYDTEDYLYFAQKASEGDKDFITSLFEMKGDQYNKTKGIRLSTDAIKAILENPPENREFLTNLIKQENEYNNYKYSSYNILELATATKIDKDLTESLLKEEFTYNNYTQKRFNQTSEILNILNSYQMDKELTTTLLKEQDANYEGSLYPRFSSDDISSLVKFSQQYDNKKDIINLVNMKNPNTQRARFNASGIKYVAEALSKDRELTENLLNTTNKWSDGTIHYSYNADGISQIISATEIDKEFALSILNDKEIKRSAEDIYYITNSSKIDKQVTQTLHRMTYVDKYGEKRNRFSGYDIANLVKSSKNNFDFLLEQVQRTIKVNGHTVYRFDADDLETVVDAYKKNPKLTEIMIGRTKVDENGDTTNIISPQEIYNIASNVTVEQYETLENTIGDNINNYSYRDILTAVDFPEFYGTNSINEIPIEKKKDFLKKLVASNATLFQTSESLKKDFPLIPTNAEEYCSLLPSVVRALGIETNELSNDKIDKFNDNITNLTKALLDLSDNELEKLEIHQEYSTEKFITDILEKLENSNISELEKQKVFDYYGFELHKNPNNPTGYSIVGYPVNLNNGKKLAKIDNDETKKVVEELRTNVKDFSENNKIKSNNKTVQNLLNELVDILPELHTQIDKKDDSLHNGNMIKNSLKVLQKIGQNKDYQNLNESDKKVMQIGALMHNIAKAEGCEDKMNAKESSFDTYFIAKKFKLTKDEEIKLYTLIKTSDWLDNIDSDPSSNEKTLQSIAFDLQQNNNFDMAKIFANASIETLNSESSKQTIKEKIDISAPKIEEFVHELKKSQPLLPVTKMPKASTIEKNITQVNPDGSTNIKGVYKDADGLVVVKFNEVENWKELGMPAETTTKGIMAKAVENIQGQQIESETETGNIKFFVHGLDYANQLAKFDAFALADSDALLSVSYAERPETKYRFFRPQGVMLDVESDYVYGGGNTDSGSGCSKSIDDFKSKYVFGGYREDDRKYISNLIKEETGFSDEEYIKFVEENKNKAMHEMEPKELQRKIIQKLATINSNHRKGNRAYNEMYLSNPKEIMGVFAYNMNDGVTIEKPLEFLETENNRTAFLKKYALEHDVPFYVFGD